MIAFSTAARPFFDAFTAPLPSVTQTNPAAQMRLEAIAFTHALVALAAKLVAVDGLPNRAEYQAFATLFAEADRVDAPRLRSLFMKHLDDHSSATQYAIQLAGMTQGDATLHEELLQKLLHIATADGALHAEELTLLGTVADIFGISRERFRALLAQPQGQSSPHDVLGISLNASAEEAHAQYRAQVQMIHPDRHQAAGAAPEVVAKLNQQLAALNVAYDAIKRQHAKRTASSWTWRKK